MSRSSQVVIVGAGLAGLACAAELQRSEISFLLIEADNEVGGRVKTDNIDGFLCDHGFQVLLTAYPAAQQVFNYNALELGKFEPGALIWVADRFQRLVDPWRRPQHAISSLLSPVGSLSDKLRVAKLRREVQRKTLNEIYDQEEATTIEALRERGFSSKMIDRFFRPFLSGIFLENDLQTTSRKFEFVFKMFSAGDAALPANGMGQLARQLFERIPGSSASLESPVVSVDANKVVLSSGEEISAQHVVLACDAATSAKMIGEAPPAYVPDVHCLYFTADEPPTSEAILMLNGRSDGPVNNVCVPSQVCNTYAPPNQSLVSATVLQADIRNESELLADVQKQMTEWFGKSVEKWEHLKTYRIKHPVTAKPVPSNGTSPIKEIGGVMVCGDDLQNASIQSAIASGLATAERLIDRLSQ